MFVTFTAFLWYRDNRCHDSARLWAMDFCFGFSCSHSSWVIQGRSGICGWELAKSIPSNDDDRFIEQINGEQIRGPAFCFHLYSAATIAVKVTNKTKKADRNIFQARVKNKINWESWRSRSRGNEANKLVSWTIFVESLELHVVFILYLCLWLILALFGFRNHCIRKKMKNRTFWKLVCDKEAVLLITHLHEILEGEHR